jgi:hypothetical protein
MDAHRKAVIRILAITIALNAISAFSQSAKTSLNPHYEKRDSTKTMWEVGLGIGVPYGVIGGKLALGNEQITADLGLGLVPFAWSPCVSLSGVLHFGDRYAPVRPKITVSLSNATGVIALIDQADMEALYSKTYPGVGAYAGLDFRLGKTSPLGIDLNIGWVFPFAGNDAILKDYEEVRDRYVSEGYTLSDEKLSLNTPKFSIGITYSPKRSFKFLYF